MTLVSEVMTRRVRTLSPQDGINLAARCMDARPLGAFSMCNNGRQASIAMPGDSASGEEQPGSAGTLAEISVEVPH